MTDLNTVTINLDDLSRVGLKAIADILFDEAGSIVERCHPRCYGEDLHQHQRVQAVLNAFEREAMRRPAVVL